MSQVHPYLFCCQSPCPPIPFFSFLSCLLPWVLSIIWLLPPASRKFVEGRRVIGYEQRKSLILSHFVPYWSMVWSLPLFLPCLQVPVSFVSRLSWSSSPEVVRSMGGCIRVWDFALQLSQAPSSTALVASPVTKGRFTQPPLGFWRSGGVPHMSLVLG